MVWCAMMEIHNKYIETQPKMRSTIFEAIYFHCFNYVDTRIVQKNSMKYGRKEREHKVKKTHTRPNYSAKDLTTMLLEGGNSPYNRSD